MTHQGSLFALLIVASSLFSQSTAWRVNTIAGAPLPLGNDGPALNAMLGRPRHIAYDKDGNLYLADTDNHQIRRFGRDGRIVAVAGNATQGNSGDGGAALAASLNQPRAVALDGNRLYIADSGNYRIRMVNLETGMIQRYAGTGVQGFGGDNGPAVNAQFGWISFLTADAQGNLLVSDATNHRVRRIVGETGIVTTVAGNGVAGRQADSGVATASPLPYPEGLAVEPNGTFYVTSGAGGAAYGSISWFPDILRVDSFGNIRKINVPVFVGDTIESNYPVGLALDPAKRLLYFTDAAQCLVRSVNLETGRVDKVAGIFYSCVAGPNGDRTLEPFLGSPAGIAFDGINLAISELDANRIRRIHPAGNLELIAGRGSFAGNGGAARDALLSQPGMAIPDGEGGYLVADTDNCVIRRVSPQGVASAFAGRPGWCGLASSGIGSTAAEALLHYPVALVRDRQGNVFVSEGLQVRRIGADGKVTTLASFLGGPAGLALDPGEQNVYVVERRANRISRINVATRVLSVVAGSSQGKGGFAGDGDFATAALFSLPSDIAVDRGGNLWVADTGNNRIRRVDGVTNLVSTVAGNGSTTAESGSTPATATGLPFPTSVALDADGAVYTVSAQRVVRFVTGPLEVIPGSNPGLATESAARLYERFRAPSVRLDGTTLLVAEQGNNRVVSLTPMPGASMSLSSGNNQSAPVRTALANPLVVNIRQANGMPAPGFSVSFAASAGTLNPVSGVVVTGNDGNAAVRLQLPANAGPVTVTATVPGLPPVTFSLAALPAAPSPRISAVITASAFGAAPRIAPGGWIELYGTGFTSETREWSPGDFTGAIAPTTLGGVRVLINERPAFLQRISTGQINAVAPDGIGAGRVPVQVINAAGNSETFFVEVALRAPALLAAGGQYAVAMLPDGTFAGTAARPARPGDRLVLYGIGFGATIPAIPAGQIARQSTALPNLRVTLGGIEARVDYGGFANGFVGLYQLNIVVPAMPAGNAALAVSVDGIPLTQSLVLAVGE